MTLLLWNAHSISAVALVVPSVGGFGACLWFAYAVRALGDRGGGNAGNVPRASECFNCCLANGRDRPHVPRASTNQCNSRRRQGGEAPISSLFAVRMIAYFGSYRPIGSAANYSVCKTIFLEGSSFVVFQH